MQYIIVGLGNPGKEYQGTRHNTGRAMVESFWKKEKFPEWEYDKKINALVSKGKVGRNKTLLILPETFMNKSGLSVKQLVINTKKAENLVVVYDDLDLPLGSVKISFNKSAGGHKGLESIIRSIKTKAFARVRVGISPVTLQKKIKKPKGEKKVHDFILGRFTADELQKIKKSTKERGIHTWGSSWKYDIRIYC